MAIKKIDGVNDVQVSLNQGTASIQLKPGNKVQLQQIRQVVESKGFTPKDATVHLTGQLISENDHLSIKVPESNEVFSLKLATGAKKSEKELKTFLNQKVHVQGTIPPQVKDAKTQSLPVILVLDLWQ